jgi:hypothetical protein
VEAKVGEVTVQILLAAILSVTTHLAIEDLEIVFNGMRGRVTARYSLALCVIVSCAANSSPKRGTR